MEYPLGVIQFSLGGDTKSTGKDPLLEMAVFSTFVWNSKGIFCINSHFHSSPFSPSAPILPIISLKHNINMLHSPITMNVMGFRCIFFNERGHLEFQLGVPRRNCLWWGFPGLPTYATGASGILLPTLGTPTGSWNHLICETAWPTAG